MKIMVTGGLGFIGSNFITQALKLGFDIVNVDNVSYAANFANLTIKDKLHYGFHKVDIQDRTALFNVVNKTLPDVIVHFAAESHVDNSIESSEIFLKTNVFGTFNLVECIRLSDKPINLLHVSTDEVFGNVSDKKFNENSKYYPSSPYSASKAASDHLVSAWRRTYGLAATITNCSNNYGPRQHPEKLLPKAIKNFLRGKKMPVYGNGKQVRDWLYVSDHVDGLISIIQRDEFSSEFCFGGNCELSNIDILEILFVELTKKVGLSKFKNFSEFIEYVEDRPGHDTHYAVDSSKAKSELKWSPSKKIRDGISETIDWYLNSGRAS